MLRKAIILGIGIVTCPGWLFLMFMDLIGYWLSNHKKEVDFNGFDESSN